MTGVQTCAIPISFKTNNVPVTRYTPETFTLKQFTNTDNWQLATAGEWSVYIGDKSLASGLAISLNNLNKSDAGYEYQNGDYVKITTKDNTHYTLRIVGSYNGYIITEFDDTILGAQAAHNESTAKNLGDLDDQSATMSVVEFMITKPDPMLCEIVKPGVLNEDMFYEISEQFQILNGEYSTLSGSIQIGRASCRERV